MLFSEFFGLNKSQSELDFVNVPIDEDIRLFLDPFAISQKQDRWSIGAHLTINSYFQQVLDAIRNRNTERTDHLVAFLHEPNETRLGFSEEAPQGAGLGHFQAGQIVRALAGSAAVRTGFINNIEECELLIPNISHDKISDLTTNIIRKHLADYTLQQCELFGIATTSVSVGPYFDLDRSNWVNDYLQLPVAGTGPVLLVPKTIVRWSPSYNHQKYYRSFVLDYLQAEHLNAQTSLVHTLKSGRRVVYKKALEASFPLTKAFLYQFSREHPDVLSGYRSYLAAQEGQETLDTIVQDDEPFVARALINSLQSIEPGPDAASSYHSLMIGILEFLFFPDLVHPVKEAEIHQGRKRIDITMENGASHDIFHELHDVRKLPCSFIFTECKNYSRDVANPEIDQLAGRFSTNRGKFGMLATRNFANKELFIERCRDTFRDDRGLIIPIDDETIIRMLTAVANGNRRTVLQEVRELIRTVTLA